MATKKPTIQGDNRVSYVNTSSASISAELKKHMQKIVYGNILKNSHTSSNLRLNCFYLLAPSLRLRTYHFRLAPKVKQMHWVHEVHGITKRSPTATDVPTITVAAGPRSTTRTAFSIVCRSVRWK